jgi:hypothetical protein
LYDVVRLLVGATDININQEDEDLVTPLNIACDEGKIEIVKLLLEQPNIDLNKKDKWNDSPLSSAAKNNHKEIVQLLKNAGATYPIKDAVAANDMNYVQQWITSTKDKDTTDINESLYTASLSGNIQMVKLFLNLKDININYSISLTALHPYL